MGSVVKSFKEMKWYEWLMAAVMILIAGNVMVQAFINPAAGGNPAWLTVINFISAVCGIFCIFFCAKANISNFGFAVVNTVVYAIYLWYWKIYGTFFLEVLFYFPMNIISWWAWTRHRDVFEPHKAMSKKLTPIQNIIITAVVFVSAFIYHAILVRVGGTVAWLDAFTVSIGIIATILEAKRYKEQYTWWIITDVIAVAMYIAHFDPVYLTKKSIYLIMAIIGYINWSRLNKRNVNNE